MKKFDLSRRDFTKMTMAAFGGMVAGTVVGCGGDEEAADEGGADADTGHDDDEAGHDADDGDDEEHDVANILAEKHICRGLNQCNGKGASGENACAGQGTCATAGPHGCKGENDCRGQGGCGEFPGQNACNAKGVCGVPLKKEEKWDKARKAFEEAMKAASPDKEIGVAPAPAA
ncbi:MAG: hypothetical protein CMJ48_08545 [Planctomycetaceae bacterium]|nr:hypothetical protein [Planctomycetaceae bacterium]